METTWGILLLQWCIKIIASPVYLFCYLGLWDSFCKKTYPYVVFLLTLVYNQAMGTKKKQHFSKLMDFAGPTGELRLLEIGTGTGANFKFYPRGCRITCTDYNPNFKKLLQKSLSKNPHLHLEGCLIAPGEDLHQIPDASVDVVVSTLVLCSVNNTEAVIREILRVLRPGGAYFFLEHVAGHTSSWMRSWQEIWAPTWKVLFDGCHLTRELWKDLEKAKFSELKYQRIGSPFYLIPGQPHLVGCAVK